MDLTLQHSIWRSFRYSFYLFPLLFRSPLPLPPLSPSFFPTLSSPSSFLLLPLSSKHRHACSRTVERVNFLPLLSISAPLRWQRSDRGGESWSAADAVENADPVSFSLSIISSSHGTKNSVVNERQCFVVFMLRVPRVGVEGGGSREGKGERERKRGRQR